MLAGRSHFDVSSAAAYLVVLGDIEFCMLAGCSHYGVSPAAAYLPVPHESASSALEFTRRALSRVLW